MPDPLRREESTSAPHARARLVLGLTAVFCLVLGRVSPLIPFSYGEDIIPHFDEGYMDPFLNCLFIALGILAGLGFLAWEGYTYKRHGALKWWAIRIAVAIAVFLLTAGGIYLICLNLLSSNRVSRTFPAAEIAVLAALVAISGYSTWLHRRRRFPMTGLNVLVMTFGLMVAPLLAPSAMGAPQAHEDLVLKEASLGHPQHLYVLVLFGADLNTVTSVYLGNLDTDEMTPLGEAIKREQTETVQMLIAHGADVNLGGNSEIPLIVTPRTQMPETPLMMAAEKNNPIIAKMLIDKGARVNAKNSLGLTPLMFAASYAGPDLVRQLIQAGADINAKSSSGKTPLMFAASDGRPGVAKLLREAGAKQ
jgi:hypothetical protein